MPDLGPFSQSNHPPQPGQDTDLAGASSDNLAGLDSTTEAQAVAGAAARPVVAAGQGSLLNKILSVVKVFVYIILCFATSYYPLDRLVGFGYMHIPDKALFMFLVSSVELLLCTGLLYLCAKFIEKKPFLSYGFSGCTAGSALKETFYGAGVSGVMVSTVMLILFLTGCYQVISAEWTFDFIAFLPFLLVAAMREEVMFRGYVYQTLEKNWGTIGAIVISSLMFGFLHMINFEPGVQLAAKLYSCICLSIDAGVVFAVAYLITRRLWFPFGMHVTWNIFEGPVYGTLVSSLNLGKPLLNAKLSGPDYLTGGVFGPEASLVEVGVCMLLVALLWRRVNPSFVVKSQGINT